MSFDSTDLPDITGDDKKDTESVRKSILDLLDKINQIGNQLSSVQSSLTSLKNVAPTFVDDSRVTTGTVNRTETVIPINVGQTALINWACGITGGTTRTIIFQLAAIGTYQYSINYPGSLGTTNTAGVGSGGSADSYGIVPGGTTIISVSVTSGASHTLNGFVKRIT